MKTLWLVVCFCSFSAARGQGLSELLKKAEANYPLLKAKALEAQAGEYNISTVRSTAVPSLDAAYQINYATYNNITGMASSRYFVPVSGPPSAGNDYAAVPGSTASLLLDWDVFTFGQRKAKIDLAKANYRSLQADAGREVFLHKLRVIQCYLDLLMAHELIKVYTKNLDRADANWKEAEILTATGLRPGVDTALFGAEVSRAKIELLKQKLGLETKRIEFAELLGSRVASYSQDSLYFVTLPAVSNDTTLSVPNPLIQVPLSKLAINAQQRKAIQHTLYPKLSMWGTAYGRGSGIQYDGTVSPENGLSFSRYNYGIGLQVSVPLLNYIEVRHQVMQQSALLGAQQERFNDALLHLKNQNMIANANLTSTVEIAREAHSFYTSADFSYRALFTRYKAGLVNYTDLIQAQYALAKADADLRQSYLDAWKALAYKAAVSGDLDIFLNTTK